MYRGRGLFSTPHQHEMSSHFPGSGALVHMGVAPGEKYNNESPLPPTPFSLLLLLYRCHMIQNMPSVHFGQHSHPCPPPKILTFPALLVSGDVVEAVLVLCQNCSAAARALLCYQHLSSHQCTAQHYGGLLWGKYSPHQPDPIQLHIGTARLISVQVF